MESPPPRPRIVYLALADARGHLMRAHLLRELLAPEGVDVEIVTTSDAGRRFLEALGTPAEVISPRFRVVYDARHDMRRHRTTARTLLYLASPWGLRVDRRRLRVRGQGAAFVVSDSLHPALLLAPRGQRVVQVYGQNILAATLGHFGAPSLLGRVHRAVIERSLHRAFARLEHTLAPDPDEARSIQLPPIIPCPRPRASQGSRAVIYLNPHFRDPAIARAIEDALRTRGLAIHAVGEGYGDREGWVPHDPALVDAVAEATLFVTGAGMGGLGMARAFGTPTVCLVSRQPEQRANARQIRGDAAIEALLLPTARPLATALGEAIDRVRAAAPDSAPHAPCDAAERIQQQWVRTFLGLVARADRRPMHHERIH
ncbi:MAG: hypothetical protein KDK70_20630 [Myxococcales bacterium]|nr:hypothetical protein [Myxococcales bacterium]